MTVGKSFIVSYMLVVYFFLVNIAAFVLLAAQPPIKINISRILVTLSHFSVALVLWRV